MEPKRKHFIVREKKPFVCGHCGQTAMGGRYVNHCPYCLWSKHVDKDIPGDRASSCQGLMKPVGVTQKHGQWRIVHRCLECGSQKIVDTASEDNFEKIIKLSQKPLLFDVSAPLPRTVPTSRRGWRRGKKPDQCRPVINLFISRFSYQAQPEKV